MADDAVLPERRPTGLPADAHIILAPPSSLRPVTRSALLITIPARHNILPNLALVGPPPTDSGNASQRISTSSSIQRSNAQHGVRPRRSRTHQNIDIPPHKLLNNDPAHDTTITATTVTNTNGFMIIPTSGIPVHRRHNIDLNAICDAASKRHKSRRPTTRGAAAVNDENKVIAPTRSTKNAGLARGKVCLFSTPSD